MASVNLSFMLASVVILTGNGRVIPQDEYIHGLIIKADDDVAKRNGIEDDKRFRILRTLVNLDESSGLKLNDGQHSGRDNSRHYHHKISVHHFARHGVCRNEIGEVRLYTALKSKLCYSKEEFIKQLVQDLCESPGSHLDSWVGELFDLDEDGSIDHFEKTYYDD